MNYTNPSTSTEEWNKKFEAIITNNLQSVDLDNSFLARRLCMSEAGLYRLVKKHYNTSPNNVVRSIRLKLACQLLSKEEQSTVREVAYSVGFSHVGYFIRRFEEQYGYKPGERSRKNMVC